MTEVAAKKSSRRRGRKTWSEFGSLGRKPSRYEILTHGMNHTTGGLELGPDVHGNVWLREHRDQIGVECSDWEGFRDPDELTYDRYVSTQNDAETYVDGLIERFEAVDADLSDEAVTFLARVMAPSRYLAHTQQMLSAYVQQLAPSAYIANCASFQTADQLRRVQRVAERTKMLQLEHPDAGFGDAEREVWETDELWQPVRRLCEEALIRYDWDEAFVAVNLVVKPVCEQLFLAGFAKTARERGAELDALIAENLFVDAARSQRWSAALVHYLVADRPENQDVIRTFADGWTQTVEEAIASSAALLAEGADSSADAISASAASAWRSFLSDCGVGG